MSKNVILPCVAALLIVGIVAFAWLHFSNIPVLDPSGIIGLGERSVIIITTVLCALIVVPVFIMLFAFAWNYRADHPKSPERHSPNWDHDSWWTSEFVWWLVPGAIVIILAVVAWQSTHALDPYRSIQSNNTPITIQVIALDWKWLFIYPYEGIATVNYLEFPVNTPVHFEITADAPMNSFWIPSLGGQIMAMAGMTNQLYLMANKIGTFNGLSANISGAGFSGMDFTVHSVSQSDYTAWVSGVQKQHNSLDSAAYAALELPSTNVAPMYYSSVDPELYTASIMKYMMAPMPMQATSTQSVPAASTTSSMPTASTATTSASSTSNMPSMSPMPSMPNTQSMPDMPGTMQMSPNPTS